MIARRILMWRPIILCAAMLIGFAAAAFVQQAALPSVVNGAVAASPFVAMCGWIWAIFQVSSCGLPGTASGLQKWIFAAPPAIVFVAVTAGWSLSNSTSAVVFFISLFVAVWLSASALEQAHDRGGKPSVGGTLSTALMMYFAPLGVWGLRAKVLQVALRSP